MIQFQLSLHNLYISHNKNLTSITIYNENETLSSNLKGDSLFNYDQNNIITFSAIEFDSNQQLGNYGIYIDYAGSTVNGIQFSNRDSLDANALQVISAPSVNYEYGLQPKNLIIGEGIQFEFYIENLGMSELILDTSTVLYFSDSENYFYSNLASKTKIYPDASNQLLIFNEMYIPQEFQLGSYMCYLNISGKSVDDADFYQNDILIDSISVGRGGAPSIKNIRYVDGGYINIPDGQINEGDIIKIKFSERLNASLLTGKSADRYFLFVTENDRFGESDSSIVVNSNAVSYYGDDSDSLLHIILGSDAILANSSATSRLLDVEGTTKTTLIRTENNPSLIIIDPNIMMGMIQGEIGSDVGYPTNRDSLDNQIIQISEGQSSESIYSKFAVLVDDKERPIIVNFYPYSSDTVGVYPFTPIKGFITGRNLIFYSDLKSILSNYSSVTVDENQLKNNSHYLPQLLKSVESSVNISSLIDELIEYEFTGLAGNLNDSLIMINPLKQMFTSINEPLQFSFEENDILPEYFINENNLELNYDASFDNNLNFNEILIDNNFEISKPGIRLSNSYLWMKISTILNNQYSTYNYKIIIDDRERPRSDGENFIWSAPNPYYVNSNEPMVIEYEISNNINNVEVIIIDSGGTPVYRWEDNELSKNIGRNRIYGGWNARNKNAFKVSSGMYLLILKIDDKIKSSWMMVIR